MINIIYEDNSIVVCEKPVGYASQLSNTDNMVTALSEQINSDIFPVHRLDTAVAGIMVYAKTQKASAYLSKQISENTMVKEYLAIVQGKPIEDKGIYEDFLFKDSRKNKTFIVTRMRNGVKKAKLQYNLLSENAGNSLVHIRLFTGRTHQIRAQFSHRKMPLLGDGKYGSKINTDITLFSHKLTFVNPENNEIMTFSLLPDTNKKYWCDYKEIISSL